MAKATGGDAATTRPDLIRRVRCWIFSCSEPIGDRDVSAAEGTRMIDALRRYVAPGSFGDWRWLSWTTTVVVTAIVLWVLHPTLLFTSRMPSGGDMTAHLLSPDILRDQLLPNLRLSGWSYDWYTGFPANTFYMIPPQLAIVGLSSGPALPVAILLGGLAAVLVVKALWSWTRWVQAACLGAAAVLVWVALDLPYGLAFKLVVVAGLLTLPAAVAFLARNLGSPHPIPGLAAIGALGFMLDQSYTIVGGNFYATMAGEFYFSAGFSLMIFGLAFAARGLREGGFQVVTASLLGAAVLSHVAMAVAFLPFMAVALLWAKPEGLAWSAWLVRFVRWFGWVAVVVGLISAVWLLPFIQFHGYLNNMGLGKESTYQLWLVDKLAYGRNALFLLTAVCFVGGLVYRRAFFLWSSTIAAMGAVMFVLLPGGILWNPRILPMYSLGLYLGAVCGLWVAVRVALGAVRSELERRGDEGLQSLFRGFAAVGVTAIALVAVILPIRLIPIGTEVPAPAVTDPALPTFSHWSIGAISVPRFAAAGWTEYNFGGFESKPGWDEYRALMRTMEGVGKAHGCGPAMWEYDATLTRFGSPMALMLLPFFTDHCIGSMEGLYFEASQTTPFHFLLQDALSPKPSRAQRNVAYRGLDVGRGVQYMQELGTRYAILQDPTVVRLAESNPDLHEVARSGAWRVYEVSGSSLVAPLAFEPVVLDDYPTDTLDWLDASTKYFAEPRAWPQAVVADGPDAWRRVAATDVPERISVGETPVVSNLRVEPDSISFDVSETGKPVRIKTSYFPLWEASGAAGPYRSFPNQMIVVPNERHVTITYGRSLGELVGWVCLGIGFAMLVARGVWPNTPVRELVSSARRRRNKVEDEK